MDWSFIICTHNPNQERIDFIISSIRDLKIPKYEIIIVGGERIETLQDIKFISFDEESRPGWITKKKNIGGQAAIFENLCILHDYFVFDYNWYEGWKYFNSKVSSWDVVCNPIKLINGARDYTDWIIYEHPTLGQLVPLNYEDSSNLDYQYVSGGYFCTKRKFFIATPLPEELGSHEAEDVAWSLKNRSQWNLKFNPYSIVRHIKPHRNMKKWRKYTDMEKFYD
jgi:hypothetical protein